MQARAAGGAQTGVNAAQRFNAVCELVRRRYWSLARAGMDWADLRAPFRRRALAAENEAAFHQVLSELVGRLDDDHSRYVSPREVNETREAYGDLPCIGVFSHLQAPGSPSPDAGDGPVGWHLDGALGVIRVADLAQTGVAGEVRAAATALGRQGAEGLVLDLRGNPGGRLVEMMRTAGVFTGGLLWRVVTRWTLPIPYPALGATATDLPVVVLVDGDVHSAAEGLAGALQASGRARVVGERTAGNVEAVLPFCLRDGSQVWLATGVLAPVGGPTWEGRGVVPDVEVDAGDAMKVARSLLAEGP
jgi:carboxyl-terminal processing protease